MNGTVGKSYSKNHPTFTINDLLTQIFVSYLTSLVILLQHLSVAPSDVKQQLLEVVQRTADIAMKTGKMSPDRRKEFIMSGKTRTHL